MGYDLFIRAERAHTTYATLDHVRPLFVQCGLVPNGKHWRLEDGTWMEVYLAVVTEGLSGGDALPGDGLRFNEIQCHPRPLGLQTLSIVMRIAARLGWEVFDPQRGLRLRDAGTAPLEPGFGRAERGEVVRIGKDHWASRANGICFVDEDRALVSFHDGAASGRGRGFDERIGPQLAWSRRIDDAGEPTPSPDRRWLLVPGPYADKLQREATVDLRDPTSLEVLRSFSLYAPAWLPDRSSTFVALEVRESSIGLVAVDAETGALSPFEPHVIIGADRDYAITRLAVTADGLHVAVVATTWLHVFSTRTGRFVRRERLHVTHVADIASHRDVTAFVALPAKDGDAILLVQLETGRILGRWSLTALGSTSYPYSAAFHPSGWLAVGFSSGDLLVLGLDGSARRFTAAKGSIGALAFTPDGNALLAAGATDGVLRVPLTADERSTEGSSPPALVDSPVAFSFRDQPPILPTDVSTLLQCRADRETQVARLLALPDVDTTLANAAGTNPGAELLLALARRAHMLGRMLDARWAPAVTSLVERVKPEDLPWIREIVAVTPDAFRVIFARRDEPIWDRFTALQTPEALALLVEIIRALPKGAFTKLKASGDKLTEYRNGYSAADLKARAIATLVSYGAAAIPVLEAALVGRFPTRTWIEEALVALRG